MFKQYKRRAIAELREVTAEEVTHGPKPLQDAGISISKADLDNGSPIVGDMIARNSKDHSDQWLVAREYFKNNFEPA
jgi:hypothetical protein